MNRMDAVHSRLFVLLGWLVTMGCVVLCPIVGLGDTMRPPAPFDDLDILGPFAGLAYSKVEGPTKMTLANLLVNWLPDVLPGMPRGEAIGGGRWRHSPPTDAAGRILGRPEWVERSIEYAVFAFASPEQAVGVMEGLFGHEGQRAWETWSDERRQYALDNEPVGTYGGPLTAQEWRATNYVTAFSWEKTGIGNNSWSEVIVYSNATATWEHFEFVVRTARTFAGNRDLGGSDYTTVAIAGEWKYGEERACFVRRGRHILAVTVALWARMDEFDESGTKLDHTIFHNPPFPADLWNQVLAIVGHEGVDAPDPAVGFDQARALLCASDEEFIRSLYHCIMHREPTAQEIQSQVGLLQSGTLRRNMVQYFFASPGYVGQNHDNARFITDACQAIYGRQPSDAELAAWPRTDRSVIVIDMLDSPEHLAATQACAALWRREAASVPTLPYFDDFSHGLDHWDVSQVTLQEADGTLMWHSGDHLPVYWRYPIPMEDVVIEFDGWCEKNGLGVMWINEESVGYFAVLGGWFNARSCSDGCIRGFGLPAEQREYVDGAHIQLGRWQHYRLVRSGDWLDFYVDGTRVIHRQILHRYEGQGTLTFASYGSVVGIANLRIYRANGQERSAAEGVLRAGADPEDAPVLGHQQPAEAVVAVSHPEPVRRHTISFLGVLGIVGLLAGAALVVVLALLQA